MTLVSSTITLEHVVTLLPKEKDDIETAIAAFAFEEDAQQWMDHSRYMPQDLKLYFLPRAKCE